MARLSGGALCTGQAPATVAVSTTEVESPAGAPAPSVGLDPESKTAALGGGFGQGERLAGLLHQAAEHIGVPWLRAAAPAGRDVHVGQGDDLAFDQEVAGSRSRRAASVSGGDSQRAVADTEDPHVVPAGTARGQHEAAAGGGNGARPLLAGRVRQDDQGADHRCPIRLGEPPGQDLGQRRPGEERRQKRPAGPRALKGGGQVG